MRNKADVTSRCAATQRERVDALQLCLASLPYLHSFCQSPSSHLHERVRLAESSCCSPPFHPHLMIITARHSRSHQYENA